jgi:hypothetical protein
MRAGHVGWQVGRAGPPASLSFCVSRDRMPSLLNMNSRQLANVLIKVLGLWACLQGIPSFVSGFLRGFLAALHASEPTRGTSYSWTSFVGSVVYLGIGIFLVLRSRYVAEKLFRNDE